MSVRSAPGATAAPGAVNEFVGRTDEMRRIASLLADSVRLLTVIGPGGIGKTRLVAEALSRLEGQPRQVYWVRLDRLARDADAAAIEDELARAVIGADFSGRSAREAMVDTLRAMAGPGRALPVVLVLDSCEHVLDSAAAVTAELLEAFGELTVVVTSRTQLGWVDEYLVPVPPLSRQQAVTLFRGRAAVAGHPADDPAQLPIVEEICRHLHDHPLCIRLAAARLSRRTLPMILDELSGGPGDSRLDWTSATGPAADPRHSGIGAVIAWSVDLCEARERLLFERMSVFAAGHEQTRSNDDEAPGGGAGAELAAIVAVCADDTNAGLAPGDIEELLERLVDRSLVTLHLGAESARYSLPESFRLFGARRLRARADERISLIARHRRYYRDRVLRAGSQWFGAGEPEILEWARISWDNLELAVHGALEDDDAATAGLEIAVGLIAVRVPFFRGSLRESRRWTEHALAADRAPASLRVTALAMLAWICLCQGDHDEAGNLLDRCVALCGADPEERAERSGDRELPAPVDFARGCELMLVHRDPRAVAVFARARARATAAGDLCGAAQCELFEALAAAFLAEPEPALRITGRHLENAVAANARWARSWAELARAIALIRCGDPERALPLGRNALAAQLAMRDAWGTVWAVHIRAWALGATLSTIDGSARGADELRVERATEIARLIGGAATLRARLGVRLDSLGPFAAETETAAETARAVLRPAAFATAEREGAALRPEFREVERMALGILSMTRLPAGHPVWRQRPSRWHELSAAEQDVAVLAAAGWTNTAIATRRGSSIRTVDVQMAAVLHKLMIGTRADIAALVPAGYRDAVAAAAARRPRRSRRRAPRPGA
ncbi:ATP-binding protein [Nocardia jinanensis]|uniref:LuxR family transcriptional regulator n=1 Tax=Nocardia jinanensis TaxID=382504 RepID=A0A917RDD1_9NOCA|nr:AAA family ATPase [Nocardia jinanensis]GGL01804.1 LuxR family transcriptional regulator [Nocardia jinanensis]